MRGVVVPLLLFGSGFRDWFVPIGDIGSGFRDFGDLCPHNVLSR